MKTKFESVVETKMDFVDQRPFRQGADLYGRINKNGVWYKILPFNIKVEPVGEFESQEPFLNLSNEYGGYDFIQAFVDAAAEIGIHPSGYIPPKAEVDAVRYHLEDMRKLVFEKRG